MSVYPHQDERYRRRWRFSFNRVIEGRRVRATKLLPAGWSRTQAEEFDRKETARLYAIARGLERPEPLIGDAVALFNDKRAPQLRDGKKRVRELAFLYPYIEDRPISELAEAAAEYVTDHPHLAAGTLHNRLAYLKAACRWAWKKAKLFQHDPTGHMEIPRPDGRRVVKLPIERVDALLEELRRIDIETCALFTLARRIGSRWISGVHARRPEDIVRHGRDVWLRIGITKGGEPKEKWVHPDARWALAHIPFTHAPNYYYRRYCEARAAVGLDALPGKLRRFVAHDIRHVIATDIRKRGGSLEDVGAALDHESRAASEIYAHIAPVQVKRVLQAIPGARKVHTAAARRRLKKAA